MKKLSINLNSDYKSFRAGFKCELEATNNLIIMSGVNGSGKSQLGEIIYGSSTKKNTITNIQRTLNSSYYQNDIILRTFKDNIEIKNFKFEEFSFGILHNLIKELNLSNSYHPFSGIAISGDNLVGYAKKIKDLVGHDKALKLTIDELKDCCYNNNIFPGGSDFDCKIYDIFYRYLLNKTFPKDGYINEEISPWEFLNNVFEDLEFEYHFKEPTWKINVNNITIQDLKLINKNTEYETDDFNNLSDGEKSIISLTFAILNQQVKPKIMILDEYDATLNPSLTEKFYKILEKYFISKDVLVIIITHSVATISMAPDYASFYEVFKKDPRIVKVEKDKYSDMQKALIKYYETEENLRKLVTDLNVQIQESDKKFILLVEGESDKIILENA